MPFKDVCSCYVSPSASVSVAWRVLIVACQDLPITCFLSNFWGLAVLKKLNTETHIYRTKYGNVTFILKIAVEDSCSVYSLFTLFVL